MRKKGHGALVLRRLGQRGKFWLIRHGFTLQWVPLRYLEFAVKAAGSGTGVRNQRLTCGLSANGIVKSRSNPVNKCGSATLDSAMPAAQDGCGMETSFGNKLAFITLPDCDSRETRLGSLWDKRPAVVVFLRHYG
jgi:hypothetical protein